jgi:ankyrin repeat protein
MARDLRQVRTLIASHVDVNAEDSLGEVPMQCAAQSKTPEIVTELLRAGANVNGKGHWGPSPLQMAVEMSSGDAVIAKQLIKAGADVKAVDDGYSVLNIAAQDATSEEVRMLLERGADPNHVELRGNTAIYWAALNCDVDKVRVLLKYGADPKITNNAGENALSVVPTSNREPRVLKQCSEVRGLLMAAR